MKKGLHSRSRIIFTTDMDLKHKSMNQTFLYLQKCVTYSTKMETLCSITSEIYASAFMFTFLPLETYDDTCCNVLVSIY